MNTVPGTIFITLHFLQDLCMDTRLDRLASDKHSSFLDPLSSNEENEVLKIQSQGPYSQNYTITQKL